MMSIIYLKIFEKQKDEVNKAKVYDCENKARGVSRCSL